MRAGSSSWVVLVRYGEIGIKGEATRARMEKLLVKNIKDALARSSLDYVRVARLYGRVVVESYRSEEEAESAASTIARVMGVVSSSPAYRVEYGDLEDLVDKAEAFFRNRIRGSRFAVRARRSGSEAFTSMDLARLLGEKLRGSTGLSVDLENPDYTAYVEVRGKNAFLYDSVIRGPGGLPIGSEGRVLVLFSGGIDSPVASWYLMKRGCKTDFVLFDLGGEDQVNSVLAVAYALVSRWGYGYNPVMYVVDFREVATRIVASVPEEYIVIILRRLMMRTASILAEKIKAKAIATGESLGQVASQTLDNMYVIDRASKLPVLRPLVGFDKEEITSMARSIGTYEYSVKVREYCLLGARKVVTHSNIDRVSRIERQLGIIDRELEELVERARSIRIWDLEIEELGRESGRERCML